jgi:hypothetical protein
MKSSPRRLSSTPALPLSGSPPGPLSAVSSPVLSSNGSAKKRRDVTGGAQTVAQDAEAVGSAPSLAHSANFGKGKWKTFTEEEIATFQRMPVAEITLDATLDEVTRALMQPEFWNDSDAKNNSTRVSMVFFFFFFFFFKFFFFFFF